MAARPLNPQGKQMLLVALMILALGFYQQYTEASGVFAPGGLAQRVEAIVDSLLEPAAAATDAAGEALANEPLPAAIDSAPVALRADADAPGSFAAPAMGYCPSGRGFGHTCP